MCSEHDTKEALLSFSWLVELLQEPPFEPCESELQFLSPAEYEEAFNEVVRRYFNRITRFIARRTDGYDSAPDLAQELFLSLYQQRASFEPSYIYRAARNRA